MIKLLIAIGVPALILLLFLVLDRVITPWQSKRWAKKALKNIQAGKIKPRVFDTTITWDAEGFAIRGKGPEEEASKMAWSEVVEATAYKRDLWSTDLICVFLAKSDKSGIQVHEEMADFTGFIEALPKHLAGCKAPSSWIWHVTTPAFAPNVTEIYHRPNSQTPEGGLEPIRITPLAGMRRRHRPVPAWPCN